MNAELFEAVKLLAYYLIFPGFLFLALAGMAASWVDRKITARLQWRVGPPFLQPFYDLRKLFVKETILPAQGNAWLFVFAPVIALLALILIADILLLTWMRPSFSFVGDLVVILYLFTVPALAGMLGASASHNPLASVGASREMKLILSYELPFILSLLVPIVKARSIALGGVIAAQQNASSSAGSLSGFLAFLVALVCLQGKMGLVPFDLGEAETELAAGSQIEYSGPLLALWKLSKMILLVVGPLFLVMVFWGGGSPYLVIAKYAAALIAAILIRNTNPRLRIDQTMKLFWGPVTAVSVLVLLLALKGY